MLQYIFPQNRIVFIEAPATKKQLFVALVSNIAKSVVLDEDTAVQALIERETRLSTAIGRGIALPHAKLSGLATVTGCLALLHTPSQLGDPQGQPVQLVFLLLSPVEKPGLHLDSLKLIAAALENTGLLKDLATCTSPQQVYHAMLRSDELMQRTANNRIRD